MSNTPNWVQPAPTSLEKEGSKIHGEVAPRMKVGPQEAIVSDVANHPVDWLQYQNVHGYTESWQQQQAL